MLPSVATCLPTDCCFSESRVGLVQSEHHHHHLNERKEFRGEHANHCTTDAVLYRFHCITSVRHNGDGILLFLAG
jgi:hypothetical protein